jgi:hypothetical protein
MKGSTLVIIKIKNTPEASDLAAGAHYFNAGEACG